MPKHVSVHNNACISTLCFIDQDGAEPTACSVAASNLLRLAEYTMNNSYREGALAIFRTFAERLEKYPQALPEMLSAYIFHHSPVVKVGIHQQVLVQGGTLQQSLFTPMWCIVCDDTSVFVCYRVCVSVFNFQDIMQYTLYTRRTPPNSTLLSRNRASASQMEFTNGRTNTFKKNKQCSSE